MVERYYFKNLYNSWTARPRDLWYLESRWSRAVTPGALLGGGGILNTVDPIGRGELSYLEFTQTITIVALSVAS